MITPSTSMIETPPSTAKHVSEASRDCHVCLLVVQMRRTAVVSLSKRVQRYMANAAKRYESGEASASSAKRPARDLDSESVLASRWQSEQYGVCS